MIKTNARRAVQSASTDVSSSIWERLWKLNCPNKVKHFLWRMTHNSHPLRMNLARKGMKIDTICPVCKRKDEDGGHLFFKCKYAKNVWRELCLEKERLELACLLSRWEVTMAITRMKQEVQSRVAILLWFIWSERNAIRENGSSRPAETLARCIRFYTEEALGTPTSKPRPAEKRKPHWHRPPLGILKLNCDGSYKGEDGSGSWGFIVRDSDGDVVIAGRGRVNHLLNPLHAEVIACLQGVQTALNCGIRHLILETDALLLKQALESSESWDRPEETLIYELKCLVSTNFIQFMCEFQNRDCNRVAHELAKLGYHCAEGYEVVDASIPEHIAVIVAAELSADK